MFIPQNISNYDNKCKILQIKIGAIKRNISYLQNRSFANAYFFILIHAITSTNILNQSSTPYFLKFTRKITTFL